MDVSEQTKLRGGDGMEVEIEITATGHDGQEAVALVKTIERAAEDAVPEDWY